VFAERPRTLLVEKDTYLLELVRYVHNNPVRAKVVRRARSSDWSSHQAYIGETQPPKWLRLGYVLGRFGGSARKAAAAFDAFVDDGRREGRRPELSGALDAADAAAARRGLGDGHRVGDGILGSDAFVARVIADGERVTQALSARHSHKRSGASGRPTVRAVIDAVLRHKDVDPLVLEERPRTQAAATVKRLVVWLWLHEYAGKQSEVGRALGLDSSMVTRYYGQALAVAGDYDEEATAVTALLRKKTPKSTRKVTAATADAHPVRYYVDVDET
jgi:hypothetical protein